MRADHTFSATERRAALSLASVFSLRMLGLFMILPVFALYAVELEGYTPTLAGLAIGIYGLTQAVFQIPLGMLSDRIGRKPVIVAGLLVFAAGSVLAAVSDTMTGVVLGRALQGAGAIASAVMALAADLTREEHRIKVMAVIGISIGASFAGALVLGPVLHGWFGVPGIFWFTAVLGLLGILAVRFWVPQPTARRFHRDAEVEAVQFRQVAGDSQLLRLNFGILCLHLVLTATFVVVPIVLSEHAGLPADAHWQVYLPVLLVSVLIMVPFIILAERYRRLKQVFVGAIAVLLAAELGLAGEPSFPWLVFLLVAFFAAFNLLEATLPSLVAKFAPADRKGTAMGVYSSSQFMGAFLGGALGGWLHGRLGIGAVFLLGAALVALWLVLAATMRSPRYLTSYLLNVGPVDGPAAQRLAAELTRIRGVAEAVVVAEDGVAYLKVDSKALDREALLGFSAAKA